MQHKARITVTLALAASALVATGAQAQSWGGWRYGDRDGGGWAARSVCSGERARNLEARLRHEQRECEIDPGTAERIHDAIDRLEDRSRDECAEGDGRSIWSIAQRYDRIFFF